MPLGLYVHIPFCQSKRFYCDFNSHTGKMERIERCLEALFVEMSGYRGGRRHEVSNSQARLTSRGFLLGNRVFRSFV